MNRQECAPLFRALIIVTAMLFSTTAVAQNNNTIIGVFSNPILIGSVLNDPTVGQITFFNNAGTAVTSGSGTNVLKWGIAPDLAIPLVQQTSVLTFTGATNLPADSATPIPIGIINFYNGTSDLNSLIF